MARTKKKTGVSTTEPARRLPWRPAAVIALLAAAIVALVLFDPQPPGVGFPNLGNLHISNVDDAHLPYNSSPASSGPHLGALAEWGIHEEPVPEELFVHNLEDGGIVFAYDCDGGCDDLASGLGQIVAEGSHRLLTPHDGIEHDGQAYRAAAVAWARVYYFDDLTEDVVSDLDTFTGLYEGVDNHVGVN